MIDTIELKINNWVAVKVAPNGITTFHQVKAIEEKTVRLKEFPIISEPLKLEGDIEAENIYGVAITKEILLENGFVTYGGNFLYYPQDEFERNNGPIDPTAFIGVSSDGVTFFCGALDEYSIGKPVMFVHELQNRFYELTGVVLSIRWLPNILPGK